MTEKEKILREIERLYDEYGENMYYFLLSLLRNKADAEETLQNVFLKVTGMEQGIFNLKDAKNYLFKMARNEALNLMRSKKIKMTEDLNNILLEPSEESAGREDAAVLEKALFSLPAEQREVIVLKVYKDFTFEETAKALNISVNTAGSRYRYALLKLKSIIKPEEN